MEDDFYQSAELIFFSILVDEGKGLLVLEHKLSQSHELSGSLKMD